MLSRIIALSALVALPLAGCATDSGKTEAPPAIAASSLDLPIEQIAATAQGRAVLDNDFPGMCQHPMYPYFKAMSLNQVAAMSKGQITPTMIAQAKIDLAALNAAPGAPKPVVATITPTVAAAH
jgi:hypothetical protein